MEIYVFDCWIINEMSGKQVEVGVFIIKLDVLTKVYKFCFFFKWIHSFSYYISPF